MHGRLKVRTSEEEKERKKKEQFLKVRAYKAAMMKIQTKRKNQEYDQEILQLTSQILLRNPDVLTLWNVRREYIEMHRDEDTLYDGELTLTEQCLIVNPKSYGAWHHRCWTLEHSHSPDWQRELQLCNKYLKMDERNFHTWNYRRYVAEKAQVEDVKELDYCTEKIKANFSNYSSWHYRSRLLPKLYPCEARKHTMNESKLKDELELVLTATFTDPNDSSAWFYHRWLLGISRPKQEICSFRLSSKKAVMAFTIPLTFEPNYSISLLSETDATINEITLTNWISMSKLTSDTIWYTKIPSNVDLNLNENAKYTFKYQIPNVQNKEIQLKTLDGELYYFKPPNTAVSYSKEIIGELQTQLDSCKSLLELEPDSKWTLLTAALLMRKIDCETFHEESLEHLRKLQKVDNMREGYYSDLAKKWIFERLIGNWVNSTDFPKCLNLTGSDVSHIACHQYVVIADKLIHDGSKAMSTFSDIDELLKGNSS